MGTGGSKVHTTGSMPNKSTEKLVFERNKEDIALVWLGGTAQKLSEKELASKLQTAASFVKVFTQFQECIEFIKSIRTEKVFIILNLAFGSATNELIEQLDALRQVDSVFVLDPDSARVTKNTAIIDRCAKTTHFLIFDDAMMNTLRKRIRNAIRQALDFSMFDQVKQLTTRDLTRDAAAFLWFQVLLTVLNSMTLDEYAKSEMIDMCEQYYRECDDREELKNIDEYRKTYTSADAVEWYTRDCFLYKLLNKALRTEDVHSLRKFRTFIVDLCKQIAKLHEMRTKEGDSETMQLYRGQYIIKSELGRLKASNGQLISTNGFISTTLDRNIALGFHENKPRQHGLIPLLFEITASSSLKHVFFADISDLSVFSDEKEILFSLGAVFKIDSIGKDPASDLYIVRMTATDDGLDSVQKFVELYKNELEDANDNVIFGRLFIDMGEYRESEIYFGTLIDSVRQTSGEHSLECAPLYHNQGRAYGCMGQLNEARDLILRALEIRRKHLSFHDPRIAHTLNSLGVIEGEMGHYTAAMSYFDEALGIFQRELSNNGNHNRDIDLQIAITKSNIGWIKYLQGDYEASKKCQQEALKIREGLLPADHPLIADNWSALGALHHSQGQYTEATSIYEKALKMREDTLPANHPAIANSYQSLGSVKLENGQYDKALHYYDKALHIFKKTLAVDHLLIAGSHKSIGSVYLEKGEYVTALEHFSAALEISHKTLSDNHPAAAECYHYMGMVFERQGYYQKAIDHYWKAENCVQGLLSIDHPYMAKIFISLANVHLRNSEFKNSEQHIRRAHEIQTKNYSHHHPDLVLTLNNLGVLYTHTDAYIDAEKYFKEALNMCRLCFPEIHPAFARTQFNLGELYARTKDFDKAISCYMKALEIREKVLPASDLSLADIHSQAGYAYFQNKAYNQAHQHFTKSLNIYTTNQYSPQHHDLKRVEENLSLIRKAMQKLDEHTK